MVHFPINILALRTVHKYERMDSFEEGNNSVTDEEDGEDENVVSMWSRDYPLSSFECDEYRCKFPVEKDFESLVPTGYWIQFKTQTSGVGLEIHQLSCCRKRRHFIKQQISICERDFKLIFKDAFAVKSLAQVTN